MSTGSNSSQIDFNHWLLRFLALVIDSIPLAIVAYIVFIIFAGLWGGGYSWYGGFGWGWYYWMLWPLIYGIFALFYFILMEASSGATLGKKLMGLQVQMIDGSRVAFDKAFIRNISKLYGLFLILDWLIAVATPGSDPRQKYTDRIAGTTVISTKQVLGPSTPPPPAPPPP